MMMTGVTRFTQLSVFSALNNLNDLTMESRYATLLGYTEEELEANFDEDMREHAQVMGLSYEDYRAELRRWYNGYRFAKNSSVRVYNPVSVAKTIGPKSHVDKDRHPFCVNQLSVRPRADGDGLRQRGEHL